MMNYINITVRGKIARAEGRARVVCGNSDYAVRFDFDEEWSEYAVKTARFVSEDGSYTDVQFEGEDCAVPILRTRARCSWACLRGTCARPRLR